MATERAEYRTEYLSLMLSPVLKKRYRILCAEKEVSMSEQAAALIEAWVKKESKK